MKRGGHQRWVIALALTWDGVRWPRRSLPEKAKAFLGAKAGAQLAPTAAQLSLLLAEDQVREIRICWVPCLNGGDDVLTSAFRVPQDRRIRFKPGRPVPLGDLLGVVYRRAED